MSDNKDVNQVRYDGMKRRLALTGSVLQENGPCPSYDRIHKIHSMSNRRVSGTSAVSYIRHSIFSAMGMVDLELGEK